MWWELDYEIVVIFSFNDSSLAVFILTINLHHFVTERYASWQLKRDDYATYCGLILKGKVKKR